MQHKKLELRGFFINSTNCLKMNMCTNQGKFVITTMLYNKKLLIRLT